MVKFTRVGPKVLLVQPNLRYRAISDNADERKLVEQAFAQSVIWGFKVDMDTPDGILVDATDFFMRDAHDVIGTLNWRKEGSYKLDKSRSTLYTPMGIGKIPPCGMPTEKPTLD